MKLLNLAAPGLKFNSPCKRFLMSPAVILIEDNDNIDEIKYEYETVKNIQPIYVEEFFSLDGGDSDFYFKSGESYKEQLYAKLQ